MNYFYPSKQHSIFTNQRQEMAPLNYFHHSLITGSVELGGRDGAFQPGFEVKFNE